MPVYLAVWFQYTLKKMLCSAGDSPVSCETNYLVICLYIGVNLSIDLKAVAM